MPAKLEIVLSSTGSYSDDSLILDFDVFEHSTAKKWIAVLKFILKNSLHLEKNFCFLGFPKTERNLSYLCSELNKHIESVNSYFTGNSGRMSYHISETFSPETIYPNRQCNQELMNKIHHHFELLIGQAWRVSPYYKNADSRTQYAINQLNNLCHEIERWIRSNSDLARDPESLDPTTIVSFIGAPLFDLTDEDYEHFSLDAGFGKVFLKYAQLGKTHLEVFVDKDEEICPENISGLRYLSGEFTIDWGLPRDPKVLTGLRKELDSWLNNHGFDPENKKLGIGRCQVAQISPLHFQGMRISEIQKTLSRYQNIQKISVYDEKGITSGEFDYHWGQNDFELKQLNALSQQGFREFFN